MVKAIGRLNKSRMEQVWGIIRSRPTDRETVNGVIATLEECGAIDACVDQATNLVEQAFADMEGIIPDSFSKIMLRAFGHFVIGRGY